MITQASSHRQKRWWTHTQRKGREVTHSRDRCQSKNPTNVWKVWIKIQIEMEKKTSKSSISEEKRLQWFSRYDKGKHRDVEDRVKEIDPSLRTDTLYISIIQRETDSAWSDKSGHHSSAAGLWQQHDEDEWTGQLFQPRHMLVEKWHIYLSHNLFQSWLSPSFTHAFSARKHTIKNLYF